MGVKADKWIRQQVQTHRMIEPFEPFQIREIAGRRVISYGTSSYGYDVRCANEFKVFTNINATIVDPKSLDAASFVDVNADVCIIPPNSFALARSVEYFRMPRDVLGICLGKSTYSRVGIVVNNTPLEPCFSQDTQILTPRGWKYFNEIVVGSEVLTLNPQTGEAEWQAVERVQTYLYRGNLLHFSGAYVDLLVTPDHSLYINKPVDLQKNEWTGWCTQKAATIFGQDHYRMNCQVNWQSIDIDDEFTIGFHRYSTEVFLKFLGLYLSNGDCFVDKNGYHVIEIAIENEEYSQHVIETLLPLGHKISSEGHVWQIQSKSLYEFLKPLKHGSQRYIPQWVKKLPSYRLQSIWEGLAGPEINIYTTESLQLADDIQEILFKLGSVAIIKEVRAAESKSRVNDYLNLNSYPLFEVHRTNVHQEIQSITHSKVPYTGMVYDVTVPHHIIFVRRKGKAVWSGNCWEGHITLEFSNTTPLPAKIYAHEGVAQVIFLTAEEICEISYLDRGGKYQGQTGVTLPKM